MNIYDPADRIVYVHLSGTAADPTAVAADGPAECHRLPAQYANQSPRTLLRDGRTPRGGRPFRPASSVAAR